MILWGWAASALSGQETFYLWGRLANPGFEGQRIRTTLFFAGQAKDGSNPYGCPGAPAPNTFLYTLSPADHRHLDWSSSLANRDFAVSGMVEGGINVASMSTWGEDFLPCDESWSLWAPMQTSPQSQDELFAAVASKPIFIMPFIESRANWTFYNEFPRWTDGRVAPGTVSQIIHLVNKYLKNSQHPEWASRWAQVYDSRGVRRFAVAIIHAASNRLDANDDAAFAAGFDLVANEVLSATGIRVGFFIDALPPSSNAPGSFKPSPERTGSYLRSTRSILGIQCFIPEIWMTGSPSENSRLQWKEQFSSGWESTGIPFLMDVSPGYDAHLVFPSSVRYGYSTRWMDSLAAMVESHGCDGLVYNSWNGYTEGMVAVRLPSADGGSVYSDWLQNLSGLRLSCGEFRRGDSNADGILDISDAVNTLGRLFLGQGDVPCDDAADSNDDGAVDISDAVFGLGFLFLGGPAPFDPNAICGPDPTIDELTCKSYAACQ